FNLSIITRFKIIPVNLEIWLKVEKAYGLSPLSPCLMQELGKEHLHVCLSTTTPPEYLLYWTNIKNMYFSIREPHRDPSPR
ncbi:hypothetical protein scyTo_0008831, partial [Scyliorhinus torazame]|nr:hypothetical protein [Scyliorhinus torazame]